MKPILKSKSVVTEKKGPNDVAADRRKTVSMIEDKIKAAIK